MQKTKNVHTKIVKNMTEEEMKTEMSNKFIIINIIAFIIKWCIIFLI